ncbi:hypothetical protein ACTXT7_012375, partial [Hymenolepis weldensis]
MTIAPHPLRRISDSGSSHHRQSLGNFRIWHDSSSFSKIVKSLLVGDMTVRSKKCDISGYEEKQARPLPLPMFWSHFCPDSHSKLCLELTLMEECSS